MTRVNGACQAPAGGVVEKWLRSEDQSRPGTARMCPAPAIACHPAMTPTTRPAAARPPTAEPAPPQPGAPQPPDRPTLPVLGEHGDAERDDQDDHAGNRERRGRE